MVKKFQIHKTNKGESDSKSFFYWPSLLLLFLMIVVPSAYQTLKGILLIVIFSQVILRSISRRRSYLHPKLFYLFIFYIFIGLLFGINGYFQNNLGALPITKEVVGYVIFYMILVIGIDNYNILEKIHKTIVFSTWFLCLYLILSVLNSFGIWPDILYYNLATETSDQSINTASLQKYGRLSTSFSSFPGLLFLQPYIFCSALLKSQKQSNLIWILLIIVTLIMIIAGRRILMIVGIIFPIIIYFSIKKIKKDSFKSIFNIKTFVPFSVLFIVIFYYVFSRIGIDIQSFIDYFYYTFQAKQITPTGEVISNVRIETIKYLFNGWLEKPLFGFGSGASHPEFLRSKTSPWNYEVVYMQFLYSWGIIGCLLYASGLYYIFKTSLKIYKSNSIYGDFAIASGMGMLAFLIGTSTNPYLLKFDSFYIIFLPIAIINLYLRKSFQVQNND